MVAFLGILTLPGCSGYLAPPYTQVEAELRARHVGISDVAGLRRTLIGYQGPSPQSTAADDTTTCFRRALAWGFWAGGYRNVCYDVGPDGKISALRVTDLVAGL